MKPAQVRMARAALNWSLGELASAACVHRNTISNYETGKFGGDPEKLALIRTALEAAGIIFVEENGEGPGVRLRKERRTDDHPKPVGRATDAVSRMEAEIAEDKAKRNR